MQPSVATGTAQQLQYAEGSLKELPCGDRGFCSSPLRHTGKKKQEAFALIIHAVSDILRQHHDFAASLY